MEQLLPRSGEASTDHGRPRGEPGPVQHTQVHGLLGRMLEILQDVIATLLIVLLFILSVQAQWRIARIAIEGGAPMPELLSEIVFVLILMEVYRMMIYYLRQHRVSVTLMVEVALVSLLRELMLKGAYEFEWPRLVALALIMGVLGGLLALNRWTSRWRGGAPGPYAG